MAAGRGNCILIICGSQAQTEKHNIFTHPSTHNSLCSSKLVALVS